MMSRFIENECDAVDAGVFSGDSLLDDDTRAEFRILLKRWHRKCNEWESLSKELKENEGES